MIKITIILLHLKLTLKRISSWIFHCSPAFNCYYRAKSFVEKKEIQVSLSAALHGGRQKSGKYRKSQTKARVEKPGQWIQQKSNLTASGDTQQHVGIFLYCRVPPNAFLPI